MEYLGLPFLADQLAAFGNRALLLGILYTSLVSQPLSRLIGYLQLSAQLNLICGSLTWALCRLLMDSVGAQSVEGKDVIGTHPSDIIAETGGI